VLVHVTHFNQLMWQSGSTLSAVIEHGVPQPQARYTGEIDRMAVAINEPVRRWRVTGTDLLPEFATAGGIDVFGMGTAGLAQAIGCPVGEFDNPDQADMHRLIAQRRVYVHPMRWTSLGLSLLEAMMIGMPVVVLASTEAIEAVPPEAGVLSTQVEVLVDAVRWLLDDPAAARTVGENARRAAQRRYGLTRFLTDWDQLLKEVQAR
jgi:glycosyltransferase involved in cell wall biosynthesis